MAAGGGGLLLQTSGTGGTQQRDDAHPTDTCERMQKINGSSAGRGAEPCTGHSKEQRGAGSRMLPRRWCFVWVKVPKGTMYRLNGKGIQQQKAILRQTGVSNVSRAKTAQYDTAQHSTEAEWA
jgi:hypothetical protein